MRNLFLLPLILLLPASCSKTQWDENAYDQPSYRAYYPVSEGREMVYLLDSIVPASFGATLVTRSYHLKDVVEKMAVQGGDTVYFINRYINGVEEKEQWKYQYTFTAVVKAATLEVTEKEWVNAQEDFPAAGFAELRFIKLINPVKENRSWDGNRYFTTGGAGTDSYLHKYNDWKYTYLHVGKTFETPAGTHQNTITVRAIDELYGDADIERPQQFQQRIFSEEVYAENVGMIYKNFIYTEFQPRNSIYPGYQSKSFGIKMQLIRTNR